MFVSQEPTSGLDSSTAWSIVQHLKSETVSKNRIVVSTIHQPSSQIFHEFDKLLLITDGKVFGRSYNEFILVAQKAIKDCKVKFQSAHNSLFLELYKSLAAYCKKAQDKTFKNLRFVCLLLSDGIFSDVGKSQVYRYIQSAELFKLHPYFKFLFLITHLNMSL